MVAPAAHGAELLASSVVLPCGRTVPNRLVKAPMEELQGPFGGGAAPAKALELYRAWARGGWGMIITGNIAIDESHLGTPLDITFKGETISSSDMDHFRQYARVCKGEEEAFAPSSSSSSPQGPNKQRKPLAVAQLVHAGRQSGRGFFLSVKGCYQSAYAVMAATALATIGLCAL